MANSTERKLVKNYLTYIGYPIVFNTEEIHPSKNLDFSRYMKKMEQDSSTSSFYLDKMKNASSSYTETLHYAIDFAFKQTVDRKMASNSALIALSQFMKDADQSFYHLVYDQFIRGYEKNEWRDKFFDYFDIDKFDKSYLCAVAISTDNQYTVEKLKSHGYKFQQHDYAFSLLSKDISIEYDKHLVYGKDIEAIFLLAIETNKADIIKDILPSTVHSSEVLSQLKDRIENHQKNQFVSSFSVIRDISFPASKISALSHIQEYELFLKLDTSLKDKSDQKKKKI